MLAAWQAIGGEMMLTAKDVSKQSATTRVQSQEPTFLAATSPSGCHLQDGAGVRENALGAGGVQGSDMTPS